MSIKAETIFSSVVHTDDGGGVSQLQTMFASVVHTDDGTAPVRLQTVFASVVHGDTTTGASRLQTIFASIVHAEGSEEGGDSFPPFSSKLDECPWIGTAVAKLWRGSNDG